LHPAFREALVFRDLLETRLDFAGFTLNDFADLFTALVRDPAQFMGQAQLFQLFDYRRCLEDTGDNYQRTRAWMRLTSTLTRYEARGCLALHDFGACRRMLDIGGNSGEFALQMCRAHPALAATVFDLPLVCQVGMEHLLGEPEQERIGFVRGDARHDPLPAGHDLISFKSMLHDWPEAEARAFLDKAIAALEPGGTLLIFERVPIDATSRPLPFSVLPILLFFRSYRSPQFYAGHLALRGMQQIVHREIDLDTRFMLITARKPRA
jgi:SAM-dependent methyltransferase